MKNLPAMLRHALPPSLAARLLAGEPLETKDEGNPIATLTKGFKAHSEAVETRLGDIDKKGAAIDARLKDLEQKGAREPGGEGGGGKSLGDIIAADDGVQRMSSAFRGKAAVQISRKDITSGNATVGTNRSPGNALVPADRRPEIIAPAERRFTVRDLIPADDTESGVIEFPVETGFVNNAGTVAEGAPKPYSDLTFELRQAPVRTIAHLFKASRQMLDDAPTLGAYIETRGRYGLKLKEERQVFFGDGTGQNLLGLVPQAKAFDTTRIETGDHELDILLKAISQVEDAELEATGIVLATQDWRRVLGIKDGDKRYLSNGPFGSTAPRIWDVPVYPTNTFAVGNFLVGAFASGGAQIFDRMDVEVLVSTENNDDFERNMATVRIEERMAFATYRPEAFVRGQLRPAG